MSMLLYVIAIFQNERQPCSNGIRKSLTFSLFQSARSCERSTSSAVQKEAKTRKYRSSNSDEKMADPRELFEWSADCEKPDLQKNP